MIGLYIVEKLAARVYLTSLYILNQNAVEGEAAVSSLPSNRTP
ncbi:MAG: hypothetical protein ABL869_05700 [Candidatus Nitrotoga sp.]